MKNKTLFIILSDYYQMPREGEFAWYNLRVDSYEKVIKALDAIREDEAKATYEK